MSNDIDTLGEPLDAGRGLVDAHASATAEQTGAQLRVGSYNVHVTNSPGKVEADLHRLMGRFDVIGVQEWNGAKFGHILDRLPAGWHAVRGDTVDTLILYSSSKLELHHHYSTHDAAGRHVKVLPGRSGWLHDSMTLWANFVLRSTGQRITVASSHPPAHATHLGHLRPNVGERATMYAEAIRNVAQHARDVVGRGRHVFLTGDWNTDFRTDTKGAAGLPTAAFRSAGLVSNWHGTTRDVHTGTWGRSLYDQVFSTARAVSSWIGEGFSSDHRPMGATFKL